jgi:hypothetical protein
VGLGLLLRSRNNIFLWGGVDGTNHHHHHHHHHWLYSPGWALASSWGLVTIFFYGVGLLRLTSNPQPGGPGCPFLSGSSPLTCLAWEILPVAYATASIALRIIWRYKPRHYAKVGIPSGGNGTNIVYKNDSKRDVINSSWVCILWHVHSPT